MQYGNADFEKIYRRFLRRQNADSRQKSRSKLFSPPHPRMGPCRDHMQVQVPLC